MPTSWSEVAVNEKRVVVGFQSAPYALYVTDWASVWTHVPTPDELAGMAEDAGILDFDTEKYNYLVAQLAAAFAEKSVLYAQPAPQTIVATAQISDQVTWTLDAGLASDAAAKGFFRDMLAMGYTQAMFFEFELQRLHAVVAAKERYITYLEENYKTVNGSELIDKYKRQHKSQRGHLDKLVPASFRQLSVNLFAGKLRQWDDDTRQWNVALAALQLGLPSELVAPKPEPEPLALLRKRTREDTPTKEGPADSTAPKIKRERSNLMTHGSTRRPDPPQPHPPRSPRRLRIGLMRKR